MKENELQISVIIPVYNAAPFIRKAVESALAQPETAEVLLIEDGSPDNSLEICKQLDAEYDKVRLFTHEGNANLGAGPTRNVGIENAQFDYIAFLDADDYYLPDRFRAERRIFVEIPDADGVYGAAGFHYYSELGKERYDRVGYSGLITLQNPVDPGELYFTISGLRPTKGYFILDTLTLKKDIVSQLGLRFRDTEFHQDTDFIARVTIKCRLYSGQLQEPVVNIGVHDANRLVRNRNMLKTSALRSKHLLEWGRNSNVSQEILKVLQAQATIAEIRTKGRVSAFFTFLVEGSRNSYLFRHKLYWVQLLARLVGGNNDTIRRLANARAHFRRSGNQ